METKISRIKSTIPQIALDVYTRIYLSIYLSIYVFIYLYLSTCLRIRIHLPTVYLSIFTAAGRSIRDEGVTRGGNLYRGAYSGLDNNRRTGITLMSGQFTM